MNTPAENQTKEDYNELNIIYRTYEIDEEIYTTLVRLRGGYGVASYLLKKKGVDLELAKKFHERSIEISQIIQGLFKKTFEELDAMIPVYFKELKELNAVRDKFR